MGTGRKRFERRKEEEEEEKEEEGMWQKRKRWNAVTRFSAGAVDLPALLLDHALWGMGLGDFPFRSKFHDSFCLTNNWLSL